MINLNGYDKAIIDAAYFSKGLYRNLVTLCDEIGVRWIGTPGEVRARDFLKRKMEEYGLEGVHTEKFDFMGWFPQKSEVEFSPSIRTVGEIKSVPLIYSPSADVEGDLIYVGHGTPLEFELKKEEIRGNIVLTTNKAFPPFTDRMIPLDEKYRRCVELGASGMMVMNERNMGNLCFTSLIRFFMKKDGEYCPAEELVEIPCVTISKETGERLKREISKGTVKLKASISTKVSFRKVTSWNVMGELKGGKCPDEKVIICAHYDGMFLSPAAIDNASGVSVLLGISETLSNLKTVTKGNPLDRTVKFIAFSAEEPGLKGSFSYVRDHGDELDKVRLLINMDELAAGRIKGFRLQFPELVPLFKDLLKSMGLPLSTHLDPFIDYTSDHFPFTLNGVPASLLWRWRYMGEYPTHQYTHTEADTIDKIEIRDLYEYVATIARCVLRVSNIPEEKWPVTRYPKEEVLKLLEKPITPY